MVHMRTATILLCLALGAAIKNANKDDSQTANIKAARRAIRKAKQRDPAAAVLSADGDIASAGKSDQPGVTYDDTHHEEYHHHHNQTIKKLGEALEAVAYAEGLIETIGKRHNETVGHTYDSANRLHVNHHHCGNCHEYDADFEVASLKIAEAIDLLPDLQYHAHDDDVAEHETLKETIHAIIAAAEEELEEVELAYEDSTTGCIHSAAVATARSAQSHCLGASSVLAKTEMALELLEEINNETHGHLHLSHDHLENHVDHQHCETNHATFAAGHCCCVSTTEVYCHDPDANGVHEYKCSAGDECGHHVSGGTTSHHTGTNHVICDDPAYPNFVADSAHSATEVCCGSIPTR